MGKSVLVVLVKLQSAGLMLVKFKSGGNSLWETFFLRKKRTLVKKQLIPVNRWI